MLHKKKVILGLIVFFFIASSNSVMGAKSDWLQLIDNTEKCIDCQTTYLICKPDSLDVLQQNLDLSWRDAKLKAVNYYDKVSNLKLWVNITEPSRHTYHRTYCYGDVNWTTNPLTIYCWDYEPINKTSKLLWSKTNIYDYNIEEKWVEQEHFIPPQETYRQITLSQLKEGLINADIGDCRKVKVTGTIRPNTVIDHYISWAGYDYTEYAWWNSSYSLRRQLTNLSTITVPLNQTSFSDIDNDGTDEQIYIYNCSTTNLSLYYNYGFDVALANDTDECPFAQTIPVKREMKSQPTNQKLSLFVPFDTNDSTNISEYSGNDYNGSLGGNISFGHSGMIGKSARFDGDGDYITIADGPELDMGLGGITVGAWVKTDDITSNQFIFRQYDGSEGILISITDDGAAWLWWIREGGASAQVKGNSGDTGPPTTSWTCVVGRRQNDGTMDLFINKSLDGEHPVKNVDMNPSAPAHIGGIDGLYYWDGKIDNLAVWQRALSNQEIYDFCDGGSHSIGAEENESDTTPPTLTWYWNDINSTVYEEDTEICVNLTEPGNCTLHFAGINYVNATTGTSICWDTTMATTGNYTPINATCEDANGNSNTTTNAWINYAEYETTLDYYCPPIAYVNESFTIWADYEMANGTDIDGAIANISNSTETYDLSYNYGNSRYENSFQSTTPTIWNYTINVNKSEYVGQSVDCSTEIATTYGLTIKIWEEVESKVLANGSNWVIEAKNYDKQLVDPYINDFGYLIARNNDQNATGTYTYCNFAFEPAQSLTKLINIGNWMGDSLTNITTHYYGEHIGCDKYWFRAEYNDGEGTLTLPFTGNYSLYFIDGVIEWENEFAPPKIVKSNLFLYLGELNIPTKDAYEQNYWVSHDELDFWGAFTDSVYIWMVLLLPFILAIGLYMAGVPVKFIIMIITFWEVGWTLLRMLL